MCSPLQRQALRRALVVKLGGAKQIALWEAVRPALFCDHIESIPDNAPVEDLRRAADALPFETWAAFNNLIFELHRGNVFDDKVKRLEGGGIEFEFGQIPRWQQFLGFVDAELGAFGLQHPTALDAGCWQGTLACELLQRGCAVAACDLYEACGQIVQERVSWLRPDDAGRFLGFRAGPIHEVVPGMGRFDLVCCQETLEHVPTRLLEATCDALLAVTGRTLLTTTPWDDGWSMHLRAFTEDDLRHLFHDGQADIRVDYLVPAAFGNYTTMRVRRL